MTASGSGLGNSDEVAPPQGFREIPLWDDAAPGGKPAKSGERPTDEAHVTGVVRPRIWLRLPANSADPVPAVLLLPGGGYEIVSHRYEGTEVADYLASRGIASATLLYRCKPQTLPAPLLDARRALALLHENAVSWGIDPARIGTMGFSAGGHLAGLLCSAAKTDPPSGSTRPAFAVFLYPVVDLAAGRSGENLLGEGIARQAATFSLDALVDDQWPRSYGLHERNDPVVPSAGLETMAKIWKEHGIRHQIHITEGKDHGFGWNRPGPDGKVRGPADWLPKVVEWIEKDG